MYKVKLIHASYGHKMEHYSTMKVASLDEASDEFYCVDIKKRLMKFAYWPKILFSENGFR